MTPSLTHIRRYITEFKFKPLFVEELGWEELRSAPLTVTVDGQVFTLRGVAEKRGLTLLQCDALPPYAVRRWIDHAVTKVHREHLIVFAAPDKSAQVWLWMRREPGKPAAGRERHYHRGETGERVAQTLAQISFSLDEEEELTLLSSVSRVKAAFDVDRVTKKFYDRFKKEHATFLQFIHGIPDDGFHRWYASVMLNRLMFIYFVQRKGFMDGDPHYLRARLAQAEQNNGNYYRDFLRVLFFQGFAVRESARSAAVNRLLGRVPYLDGGLFAVHPVEERYGDAIEIENAAFARLFDFFDDYNWHLDERPLRHDNEINPDVLGYIFEKYINQKQMGAYYTKEDITDYIGKNTILPYLLDAVRRDVPAAFDASADLGVMLGARRAEATPTIWRLLAEDPDRYIYPAMRHGVDLPLPETIAVGIGDVSRRTEWNRSAPAEYALPTEIWREVVARRQRYAEVRSKLTGGAVTRSDDLITLNLNIRQFVRDLLDACEDPALLRAFWRALRSLAVLDPTGGSGAFLFAALTILEDLYDACLERMEWFLAERGSAAPTDTRLHDFQTTLAEAARHPNRRYFILKSIIVHNLYAVDIMEEAVEICKLRLFLKLVAQIERADQIEPLPDIDFNIRAGNTLVGFVSCEDVRAALELEQTGAGAAQGRLIFGEEQRALDRIEQKAQEIDRAFASFRALQTQIDAPADAVGEAKAGLKAKLRTLEDELNRLLARVYGVEVEQDAEYRRWLASHKPFHWFVEFYGVLARGGFDVIVGNPPYVEYSKVKNEFAITGYSTIDGGNLYVFVLERAIRLLSVEGCLGMITPMSLVSTDRIATLRTLLLNEMDRVYLSNYSGDAHP
ncbi:MAG: Eco57I restriction-modification methylase domain-containing protein, partial [Caldilinea sp.]